MSTRMATCPFCRHRYDIAGKPGGSRFLCSACGATLIVPQFSALPKRRSFRLARELAVALGSGIVASVVMYFLLSGAPRPVDPGATATKPTPAGELTTAIPPPLTPRDTPIAGAAKIHRWQQNKEKTVDLLCKEFGAPFFNFNGSSRPYLLAVEKSDRYYFHSMAQDYLEKLSILHATFMQKFREPVGLSDIEDDVLVVIVFKDRESFDDYCRGKNSPFSPLVNGVYEFGNRRVVTYHDSRAPFDVIFHEGVHQLVHHFTRDSKASFPFWFHEGLADCFEAFEWKNRKILPDETINRKDARDIRKAVENKTFIPLRDFIKMTTTEVWDYINSDTRDNAKVQLSYAQAWALVHFLRNGENGKYREAFHAYFHGVLDGSATPEDFIRSFDSLDRLESEFVNYTRNLKIDE